MRWPRVLRLVYVLALAGATFNHSRELWQGGWLPYDYAPLWTNIFWTALTFLDPLAIWLLLRQKSAKAGPAGVWLTLGIMLLDVAVNLNFGLQHGHSLSSSLALLAQGIFLGFVLGSAPLLLRKD
ncbi:hypothetical protein [Deinococcus sp.]|uniref:hypothetical protein n=1 Tax=Deinococcus sp. TaxID=47478 RepID=UPI0025BC53F2|nr:hypothetical protein [Deinococcus sp.]